MERDEFYFVEETIMGKQAILDGFAQGDLDMRGWRIRNCPDIADSFVLGVMGGSHYHRVDQCRAAFNVVGKLDQFRDTIRTQLQQMALVGQRQVCWFCWHSSGLTWPDPAHPAQNHDADEVDPDFPCPITAVSEPGYQWFPESANCQCVLFTRNLDYDWAHTVIPWHAVNPFVVSGADLSDASLSPRQIDNLRTFLGWLNEFGFETLIVRPAGQGAAPDFSWEPTPSNDDFANAIDLSAAGVIPDVGAYKTMTLDQGTPPQNLTLVHSSTESSSSGSEPDKNGAWSVWFRVTADNRQWSVQASKPNRFVIEAFHSTSPGSPAYWNMALPADATNNGGPLVFSANDGAHGGYPFYYIRVSMAVWNGAESFPDFFALNYGRNVAGTIPTPDYPALPFPIPAGWNEDQFVENSAFTRNLTNLVEANKGALRVIYDLGSEEANSRLVYSPIHRHYCARLWREWSEVFGTEDSCGFSALQEGYGIGYMIDLFKQSGLGLPGLYAFDSYGHEISGITRIHDRLKAESEEEARKAIHIFETFYNDAEVAADIGSVIRSTGAHFGGVVQWPLLRGGVVAAQDPYFEDSYPWRFSNYVNL